MSLPVLIFMDFLRHHHQGTLRGIFAPVSKTRSAQLIKCALFPRQFIDEFCWWHSDDERLMLTICLPNTWRDSNLFYYSCRGCRSKANGTITSLQFVCTWRFLKITPRIKYRMEIFVCIANSVKFIGIINIYLSSSY